MGQCLSHPVSNKLLQRAGNAHFRVGVAEMQGFRMNMEDTHSVRLRANKSIPTAAFFGVFDGHAGEKASLFLSETLHERIAALEKPTDREQIIDCILKVDQEFLVRKDERSHGSTAVFAVIEPVYGDVSVGVLPTEAESKTKADCSSSTTSASSSTAEAAASPSSKKMWKITVGNVGDSRAIMIRSSGQCIPMTEDHKPGDDNERDRIQKAGGFVSANRVDGQLAMSRAIGDWSYKGDTNLSATKQKVIALPDVTTEVGHEGDMLLLCCDGLVEQMSTEDVAKFVHEQVKAHPDDPAAVMAKLLDRSLEKGSKDNMTAMLVCLRDGTTYAAPDEYAPGPYYPDSSEFVDAFKSDCERHNLKGAELEKFIERAKQVPKIETPKAAPLLLGMSKPDPNDPLDDQLGALSEDKKLLALMEILQKSGTVQFVERDDDDDDDDSELSISLNSSNTSNGDDDEDSDSTGTTQSGFDSSSSFSSSLVSASNNEDSTPKTPNQTSKKSRRDGKKKKQKKTPKKKK